MFPVLQTKFFAFRKTHPIGEKILVVLCFVTLASVTFNPFYLVSVVIFLEHIGTVLAQKSYGLGAVSFAFVFLSLLWMVSFMKSLKEEAWGVFGTAQFAFAVLVIMLTVVILQLPEVRILKGVAVITGLIFLGGAVAMFSKQSWNMARKADEVMKAPFYYASVAFPVMYFLMLALVFKKIF